jgi:hypothetical protein
MRSEPLLALIEARRLVAGCWTRSSSGVDGDGVSVSCMSPTAVGFCLLGAIERATNADRKIYRLAYERVHDVVRPDCLSLMLWNDTPGRTQAEVLNASRPRHCGDDAGERGKPRAGGP